MEKRAFLFPGQGSQAVGMGMAFAETSAGRELLEQADEALKFKLSALMREGPLEELTLTSNAQPALLVAGMLAFNYLRHTAGKPLAELAVCVAGHSLGEYTAVCAAGGLAFEDALRLVRLRGSEMAKVTGGGMVALLGLEANVAEGLEGDGIYLANDNAPGQQVFSGPVGALDAFEAKAKEAGAKRAIRLNVSGPFHTPAMAPAAEAVRTFLASHPVRDLEVPCVADARAEAIRQGKEVAEGLAAQVVSRVRWRDIMRVMAEDGVTHVVELGAGKVLAGLAPRCDARLGAVSLETPAAIDAWLEKAFV